MTNLVHVNSKPVGGSTVVDVGQTEHVEMASGVRQVQADAHTVTMIHSNEHLTPIHIQNQEMLRQKEQNQQSKCNVFWSL